MFILCTCTTSKFKWKKCTYEDCRNAYFAYSKSGDEYRITKVTHERIVICIWMALKHLVVDKKGKNFEILTKKGNWLNVKETRSQRQVNTT